MRLIDELERILGGEPTVRPEMWTSCKSRRTPKPTGSQHCSVRPPSWSRRDCRSSRACLRNSSSRTRS